MRTAVIVAIAFACGCSEPDVGRAREAVFGGAVDSKDEAIVALLDGPLDGPHELCSATIVAARVAVTAAHCVYQSGKPYRVLIDSDIAAPARSIDVGEVHVFPSFTGPGEDQRAGFDLAVLVLAEDAGVAPVSLASAADGVSAGASVDLVGFGQSTLVDAASIGVRHRASANVSIVCDRLFAAGDASHGFCGGDSGGAVLVDGKLAGVIGFGVKPACAPPGFATRVAPYAKWIQSFIDGKPDVSCASCPASAHCDATQGDAAVDAADADAAAPAASSEGSCGYGRASSARLSLAALAALGWLRTRSGVRPRARS